MMHIDELKDRIFEISQDKSRSVENIKESIKFLTKDYAATALNVVLDINETSLTQTDANMRLEDLCKKTGLTFQNDKFH